MERHIILLHMPQASDEYLDLIATKGFTKRPAGYSELHHILPESMFPQFAKEKWNLIYLRAADHFMAHYHLAHCVGGQMWNALVMMTGHSRYDTVELNAQAYEEIRVQAGQYISDNFEANREVRVEALTKAARMPEKREASRRHTKAVMNCPVLGRERRESIAAGYTDDVKARMSVAATERNSRPEKSEQQSTMMKERMADPVILAETVNRLKAWSADPENKKKISQKSKEFHANLWWWESPKATAASKLTWAVADKIYALYREMGRSCVKIFNEVGSQHPGIAMSVVQRMIDKFEGKYEDGTVNRGAFNPQANTAWVEFHARYWADVERESNRP